MNCKENKSVFVDIEELKIRLGEKSSKRFGLDLLKRVAQRLMCNAEECAECESHLLNLSRRIGELNQKQGDILSADYKSLQQAVQRYTTHLQKVHKQVPEGYYAGVFLSLGLSAGAGLGIVFGTAIFDNVSMALPLGIGLGLALGTVAGAAIDADAKKKGLTF